jgi:fructose-1,6-bisphosphatase
MPTILFINGWRFFFYSNEKNEPVHIHCSKPDKEIKYWIDIINYDIEEAFSYNIKPSDRRIVRKIIFENFDYIVSEWKIFKNKK